MDSFNRALFLALNASDDPLRPLVWIAILCAKYLFLLVPLHIALVWLGGRHEMRFTAIVGGLALVMALLASGMIGLVWHTPRPFILGLGHTLIEHRPSAAFPSNHAIVCFVWAAVLAIYGRERLAWTATAMGLLVAWSRIYLGIHFPLDMVGAGLLAVLAAVVTVRLTLLDDGRLVGRLDAVASRFLPVHLLRPR